MRRREFIAGLGSAAVWPVVAHAQQSERMRRIGVFIRRLRMRIDRGGPVGDAGL
jgi:hypothetical protein